MPGLRMFGGPAPHSTNENAGIKPARGERYDHVNE